MSKMQGASKQGKTKRDGATRERRTTHDMLALLFIRGQKQPNGATCWRVPKQPQLAGSKTTAFTHSDDPPHAALTVSGVLSVTGGGLVLVKRST